MKAKPKIGLLVITGAFYPDISGGALQMKNICRRLPKEIIDIHILTTTFNRSLKETELADGSHIYRILLRSRGILSKSYLLYKIVYLFLKIRKDIDLVLFSGFFNRMLFLSFLSRVFGKKIIQRLTLTGEDDPVSVARQRFGRIKYFFYSMADFYIAVSPALAREALKSFGKERVREISVGVDTVVFAPVANINDKISLRRELTLPISKKIIIFVGLICERKGVDILLEAWKKIRGAKKSHACIILVGSTDKNHYMIEEGFVNRLRQDINAYQMGQEVFFIKENNRINEYLRASDIFVLPTRREGMPNVILEAMASGLACITTRLAGITDAIITHRENGLLFEINNIDELAENLKRVLEDDDYAHQLGKGARDKISRNYFIGHKAQEYIEVCRAMLNQGLKSRKYNA